MDKWVAAGRVRQFIGDPPQREVAHADILDLMNMQIRWLAGEMGYEVTHETHFITLVADQREYLIDTNILSVMGLKHNGRSLTPNTVYSWNAYGRDWTQNDSGTPNEYAQLGRKIVLYPPPDSTAVSDDKYIEGVIMKSPLEVGNGAGDLCDLDWDVVILKTAQTWLGLHPTPENQARLQFVTGDLQLRLQEARNRNYNLLGDHQPRILRDRRRRAAR